MNKTQRKTGFFLLGGAVLIFILALILAYFGENKQKDEKIITVSAGVTAIKADCIAEEAMLDASVVDVILVAQENPIVEEVPAPQEENLLGEGHVLDQGAIDRIVEQYAYLREDPEVILTAQLGEAEAGDMDIIEIVAAILTVYNRIADPIHPDNVEDIIYERNQYAKPKAKYSENAMQAAIVAYYLYSTDQGDVVLPQEYESFFGWGRHNYFYDYENNYHIYEGLIPLPDGVEDAKRRIIPEL